VKTRSPGSCLCRKGRAAAAAAAAALLHLFGLTGINKV
jgi:hypothetical protein